jgi:hypothetical protein
VTSTPTPNPSAYNLGINGPTLNYYNDAPMYADVTNQMAGNAGRWDKSSPDVAAPVDSTGAPTVAAWAGFTMDYPSGQYTLSWDGTGSFYFFDTGAGKVTMGTPAVTISNGVQHNVATVTIVQNPSGLSWTQINATPPVTNIHMMVPTENQVAGSVFTKDFLTRMAPFSDVRFMDLLYTNGTLAKNWSDRTWPSEGSRAGTVQGMAYEDIIDFANHTGKDVWINVPVLATDDYVCRLARLLLYGEPGDKSNSACSLTAPSSAPAGAVSINPVSKIHVEFSNETWNWAFQQTEDLYCMANGRVPQVNTYTDPTTKVTTSCTSTGYPASYPSQLWCRVCDVASPPSAIAQAALSDSSLGWAGSYGSGSEMSVLLTKRTNDIFKAVFGSRSGQIKTVQNVQSGYAAEIDQAFQFMKKNYGSLPNYIDYMAVAPYAAPDSINGSLDPAVMANLTTLFADLNNVLLENNSTAAADNDGDSIYQWIQADLAEANAYGLPLVAYEGGQGLDGTAYTSVENPAQSDARMYTFYKAYFAVWDKLVGRDHLFNAYTSVGSGVWGDLQNLDDAGSQKWDALISLTLTPGDANGDGSVDQTDCAIVQANYGKSGQWWSEGDFNHDGVVNADDLAILNQRISGAQCVAP